MGVQMSKQRLNGGVATSDRRKKKKSSRTTHHHHHPRQPTTSTSATTFDHHSKTFNDKLSHRSMSSTTTTTATTVNGHAHHHAFATDGPLSTLSSAIQSPTSPKRTRWTTAGSSSSEHPHHHHHHHYNRSHVVEMDHRSMASCKSEDSAQAPSIASTASVERTASVTSQPESVTFDRNDEQEYNRQLRQHYILKQILGGNIQLQMDEPPKMILDSAAGAGFWAFEIAQKYPESKVVAMDISLPTDSAQVNNGQPITPNVSFVFGDILNTPLPFADGTFDLVYQREVGAIVPIPYWKPLFEDFARILKPNGSVHLVEYDLRMPDCGPLTRKGNKAVDEFALATGYNMKFTEGFEGHLLSVGFTDVRIQEFPIPVGEWPEDEIRLQQGFLVKSVFKGILKMVKPRLAPFLELTLDEYDQYCVAVMDEIERNKGLTEWKVITARKA